VSIKPILFPSQELEHLSSDNEPSPVLSHKGNTNCCPVCHCRRFVVQHAPCIKPFRLRVGHMILDRLISCQRYVGPSVMEYVHHLCSTTEKQGSHRAEQQGFIYLPLKFTSYSSSINRKRTIPTSVSRTH